MDKIEVESAIKSIFQYCLNDPDIEKTLKDKLHDTGDAYTWEGNQRHHSQVYLSGNNNSIPIMLKKLNEILENQKKIENLIQLEPGKGVKEENAEYSVFEEPLEVWNCINSLNFDNRDYIKRLCGSLDVLAILSLGRDDGKIDYLWQYIKEMAVKGDTEETEVSKLNRYFEFCLKVANSTKMENERYVILDIEIGSEYDWSTCIKTTDSKQIGNISDIVVRGVRIGKDIKYQAIVRVE